MNNGANYGRAKLHHRPSHSDIGTSNQLNTPPGRLSRLFQTNSIKQERGGAYRTAWITSKQKYQMNFLSAGIPDGISCCYTIPMTISEYTGATSEAIPNSNSELTHRSTLLL